ncbi:hypothetical protein OEG84_24990 [Hoeflea sp. G2-23]|uniref:Uncharacterized protein n=1 Tax=Hoeflea algicola TaxID=2983763 RepID=A0ABT3Z4C1_9HYPH|nr:hypothetical protein [Hoeflea algicola]MCY0146151.1 hypothetical protein [Hoeflea algicola]MCY0150864.1 hypothetical protein [Hoeflea algicola]
MTVIELQWLVGISATVVLSLAGLVIGSFRVIAARLEKETDKLSTAIAKGNEKLAHAMKMEGDRLHDRLNRVRDEYVPRREMDDHMNRIDKTLDEIKADQKSIITLLTGRASP